MAQNSKLRFAEDWAEKKGGDIAVVDGAQSLSWRQLDQAANSVAHALIASGVTSDDVIAMRTVVRHEWVIFACAMAKIGCTTVGINWRLTPDELRFQLSNSGATVFACDDADPSLLRPVLVGLPIKLAVSLDTATEGFRSFDELLASSGPALRADKEPGLIIYTSGTTGRPKGVASGKSDTSQEAQEYRESLARYRRNLPGGVTLVTMPVHHGSGPSQIWAGIHQGNKIVLMRQFKPEAMLRLIQQERVVTWTAVPTMLKRLSMLPAETIKSFDLSSLKALAVGGSPVPPEIKSWVLATFGDECLQEGYGATEVGMIAALTPQMQRVRPSSCGLPHRHVHIRVRDEAGTELPQGEIGELWVRTPSTIKSYLNEPPLGPDVLDSDGFFRTGDTGRVDSEGYLYITDRVKDMIISGGVNIYPAEIEAALRTHPVVLEAAAIGIPDDEFGERVHAFCELVPGASVDEVELLEVCAAHLASYKRPRRIEILRELPRNTMGKVLKRELRTPFWQGRTRAI